MSSNETLDEATRVGNFESLRQSFFFETGAVGAAKLAAKMKDRPELENLLRFHHPKKVTDPVEIYLRDLFDSLFNFCSLVEIGAQIGAVPDPLPRKFHTAALRILSNPACHAYYTDHYPIPLPQALLRRLSNDAALTETMTSSAALQNFQELLNFELGFSSDEEISTLLRLLDSFTVGGETLASVVDFAKNVQNYQEAVSAPPNERHTRGRALRGFGKLLGAMMRLDALLANCEPFPLLQSSIWHYYEYWIIRATANRSLLDIVAGWGDLASTDDSTEEREAFHRSLEEIQTVFERLQSAQYHRVSLL